MGSISPSGNDEQARARRRTLRRVMLFGGLIVALTLVAVGSNLLATRFNSPKAQVNKQVALFDTSVDNTTPPTATPTTASKATPTPTISLIPSKQTITACAPPSQMGQVIIVCKSKQNLSAYQDGKLVYTSFVETGRASLPTPTGVFHIFYKNCSDKEWLSNSYNQGVHNANCTEHNGDGYIEQFTSPFPPGSPDWYYPTNINYAMEFADGGFFLHDAWWHCDFGPGSNVDHYTSGCPGWAGGHYETGSHGCVGLPVPTAAWLYAWSHIGTTVIVSN